MPVDRPADGYATDGALPDPAPDVLSTGTNLLLVGNADTGAETVAYRLLAPAPHYDESVVLMTTERSVAAHVDAYRSALADPDDLDHLFVVDGSHSGLERDIGPLSPTDVESAASPADVTGLGVGLTNQLRSLPGDRARIALLSLSPVVDRLGPEKTFAFAHVLTSRVRNAGFLGLFAVDPTRHRPEHIRIFQSLVDGSLRFRTADDGRPQVRGSGCVDALPWTDI
jgi:KaiC/GvpD/RAD55 family RecA-like ATPase